jgi:hypothetical protein
LQHESKIDNEVLSEVKEWYLQKEFLKLPVAHNASQQIYIVKYLCYAKVKGEKLKRKNDDKKLKN